MDPWHDPVAAVGLWASWLVRVVAILASTVVLGACAATRGTLTEDAGQTSGAAFEPAAQARPRRSVADGLFTRAQASRGERRFQQACAACHRRVEIRSRWFQATAHETLSDLYEQIALTMPEGNPGSLSPEQYTDILAFILMIKDYPAGDEELPPDQTRLQSFSLEAP
ncbi:MAG: cytochrome c, partial [Gammaproteobacteria bacterium]|nr:cytochrome c [Gammaproteobacteria bacterium]